MAKQKKERDKELAKGGGGADSSSQDLILDVNEAVVNYTLNDTFSTLLEKCLSVFNIKGNESTTRSQSQRSGEDENASRKSATTKQALLYDPQMVLVTMLREVNHGEHYTLEIIDDEILQFNSLSAPRIHK